MKAKIVINQKEFEIAIAETETLLESCLKAQIEPPYSCLEGVCSFCEAEVCDGVVRERYESSSDTGPKIIKTCQSFPVSKTVKLKYIKNT